MKKPEMYHPGFFRDSVLRRQTVCRRILRQQPLRPTWVGAGDYRRTLQHPHQVAVWIQPILLRRLNHAEDHGAALRPVGRVGKQEVVSVNHKWLDAPCIHPYADIRRSP